MRQLINCMNVVDYKNKGTNILYRVEKSASKATDKPTKSISIEKNPSFSYYVTKPEFKTNKTCNFITVDQVDRIDIKYDNLYEDIAKRLDNVHGTKKNIVFYQQCVDNRKKQNLTKLHADYNLHMSDMNLIDYKIREYLDRYSEDIVNFPLEKSFMDIEVDTRGYEGFPQPNDAPCPISMVSLMYEPTLELYSFLLVNPENKSQVKFFEKLEDDMDGVLDKYLKEFFPLASKINIEIFEDELDLIKAYFKTMHKLKPDFCGIWNGYFDLKTFDSRLRRILGDDNPYNDDYELEAKIRKIVCHEDFPIQKWYLREDTFHSDFSKKKHTFDVTSYTQYTDLLYVYAALRVAKGKMESYNLEAVCMEELGEGKVEFEGHISDAMYIDYEKFFIYSLTDSYRLFQLEKKNNDIELMYNMSQLTYTRFNMVMQKTTSIRNFAAKRLYEQNYILSNNKNKFKEITKTGKFRGALVLSPHKMDNVGIDLNGKLSRFIFDNSVDQDLAAMYPNIILSGNIDSETMIGKIYYSQDPVFEEKISDLLIENNISLIGNQFLNLPTFQEVASNLEHYLS